MCLVKGIHVQIGAGEDKVLKAAAEEGVSLTDATNGWGQFSQNSISGLLNISPWLDVSYDEQQGWNGLDTAG